MGSFPSRKTSSAFDPKSLKIALTTKISVINDDLKKKQSCSTLNIPDDQSIKMLKNDPNLFTYFLCTKFDALKELNLDDDLNDGNPIEIRKVDIDKKIFPKKNNHSKLSKFNNSNKNLSTEKNNKPIHPKKKHFSCVNIINKGNLYKTDDLKEKQNLDKNNEFILNEGNCKSPQTKLRRHKKNGKNKKNKDYKKDPSISMIKPNNYDNDNKLENGGKDSLEPIRAILEEMGI